MVMPEPLGRRHFIKPDDLHAGDVTQGQVSPSFMIVCPICGFDYNDLIYLERVLGWESVKNGQHAAYRWTGRGDGVTLTIEGECGHVWVLCLAFHKGQLYIFAALPEDGSAGHEGRDAARYRGLPDWCLRFPLADDEDNGGTADPQVDF